MPDAPSLAARLRHPDAAVRRVARQEIAHAVRAAKGDLRRAAQELGISLATVRKWRHEPLPRHRRDPTPPAAEPPPPLAPEPAARSPFADFRPEHRHPLPPEGWRHPAVAPAPPQRPAGAPRPAAGPGPGLARREGQRRIAFVLHAHLPWVLGHGAWPHGEEWLAEAICHCYLPLIAALRRLAERGGRDLLALSVTPVLAAQLADRRTPLLVERWLEARRTGARRLAGRHLLGDWWQEQLDGIAAQWQSLGGDLIAALRRLEADGVVELATAAATHAYLPLLHSRQLVGLQVETGCQNHERFFGRRPRGFWMPECAYRPAGPWRHPTTGAREAFRPGNEAYLEAAGIRWTVVDAHLLLGGEQLTGYGFPWSDSAEGGDEAPAAVPGRRLQPARIGGSGVAALPREPRTAWQVWSRGGGYPGDPRYLDFHKRHDGTGLRLWRVTDADADLGDKLPYWPEDAAAAVTGHARHFLELAASLPGTGGGMVICPFDAELFGHWWFEGPQWLEAVLEHALADPRLEPSTPSHGLAAAAAERRVRLGEGSWGEAGDHRVWANEATRWMWHEMRQAEGAVAAALAAPGGDRGPWARALLVQLMLLASSDWPFLVTTGAASDYAADRFRLHRRRLDELLRLGPAATLPRWTDDELAELDVRPQLWSQPIGDLACIRR
ncbi:MAG TPA: 1,4-alpha-glucan branching protein domain-containing protein [Thermoanaerobaculia bacterium]|nr:1,4-alpha-glucan branching protein domain-containing protein [Thermoanaerobaculia bacterium]